MVQVKAFYAALFVVSDIRSKLNLITDSISCFNIVSSITFYLNLFAFHFNVPLVVSGTFDRKRTEYVDYYQKWLLKIDH